MVSSTAGYLLTSVVDSLVTTVGRLKEQSLHQALRVSNGTCRRTKVSSVIDPASYISSRLIVMFLILPTLG